MTNVRWLVAGLVAMLGLPACACRATCRTPCPTLSACGPGAVAVAPAAERQRVLLEAAILQVPADRAGALLGPTRGRSAGSMEILPAAEAATFLAQVGNDPATTLLQMPSLLSISGDEASIGIGESYKEELHRPAGSDGYTASLEDPYWSGQELRVRSTVSADGRTLALDVGFILREPPATGSKPEPASLLANQVHGRFGVATIATGDSVVIVLSRAAPSGPGDRYLLFVKPTVLPAEVAKAP